MTSDAAAATQSSATAEARRKAITDRVAAAGSCTPQELAVEYGVSVMTIHRDLDELQRRGVVSKFRGGVTTRPSSVFESQLPFRMVANTAAKDAVAQAALQLVEPGMSLILDDSTTVLHMIPGLADRAPLHVITPFLTAMRQLADLVERGVDITVIGLGGTYEQPHDSFLGMQCIKQVEGMRADLLFMSASAVSADAAFHQDDRIVALKRAQISVAAKRYLLIDSSKTGRFALHQIAPLRTFDQIFIDDGADPMTLAAWTAAGIPYEVAH